MYIPVVYIERVRFSWGQTAKTDIYATTLDNFRVVRNSRNQYNKWMFNGKTAINRTESVF